MKSHKHTDDTRIALLEQSIGHINQTLIRMEKRFDKMDSRFDSLEGKVDSGFKEVNNRLWKNFFWIMGTYLAGFAGMCSLVQYMMNH